MSSEDEDKNKEMPQYMDHVVEEKKCSGTIHRGVYTAIASSDKKNHLLRGQKRRFGRPCALFVQCTGPDFGPRTGHGLDPTAPWAGAPVHPAPTGGLALPRTRHLRGARRVAADHGWPKFGVQPSTCFFFLHLF